MIIALAIISFLCLVGTAVFCLSLFVEGERLRKEIEELRKK